MIVFIDCSYSTVVVVESRSLITQNTFFAYFRVTVVHLYQMHTCYSKCIQVGKSAFMLKANSAKTSIFAAGFVCVGTNMCPEFH